MTAAGLGPIVVGIDGSDGGWHAFGWAHDEAARTGRNLVVAYADESAAGNAAGPAAAHDFGHDLLCEAAGRLAEVDSDVPVTTMRRRCTPEQLFTDLGSDAAMLVLGRDGRGHPAGAFTGWAVRHAACPVAVVPPDSGQPALVASSAPHARARSSSPGSS